MIKLNHNEVLNCLLNKHKIFNNPIGDLCKDALDDLYDEEMTTPRWCFNHIKLKCTNSCYINALEPLRGMYNRMVKDADYKLYINPDKEGNFYEYKKYIDYDRKCKKLHS